ncbi:hypothetical protein HMPREF3195_00894 [Peptostreptococcus anaerobius]|uniref:Uncharacterized protein n=1 Tax=Peptostreptococcus anaerobius TaxID=1261 RepID=A0A135YUK5_9FIRM|nr:hypothetical protein HMPREF3195_00894 [Peptostreptococcus anaerobius]
MGSKRNTCSLIKYLSRTGIFCWINANKLAMSNILKRRRRCQKKN